MLCSGWISMFRNLPNYYSVHFCPVYFLLFRYKNAITNFHKATQGIFEPKPSGLLASERQAPQKWLGRLGALCRCCGGGRNNEQMWN